MEKAFLITEESRFYKRLKEFKELEKQQSIFMKDFFDRNGIETTKYRLCGDGFVNVPFSEHHKNEIYLEISPTEKDLTNFSKQLSKTENRIGLRTFRKNSKIGKSVAQECIDNKVVINLMQPEIDDYFTDLIFYRRGYDGFESGDKLYFKIDVDNYFEKEKYSEIPDGFEEIKVSEYHIKKEEYEEKIEC